MYGKVMSLPDSAMQIYFKLVTRYTPSQVEAVESALTQGTRHPRDVKMELAREIVSIFHSEQAAIEAEEQFKRVFQSRQAPDEIPEYALQAGQTVLDVLLATKLVTSKSDGRRMVEQKGVRLDGDALSDAQAAFPHTGVLQIGKRKFVRVK
ncbi:MAG: tyrosine--tRNA ligase, partial [Chloroflexi bacterium]|nr:tyrosine--tRNA ligase [Chloroflexota bacterium]